MIEQQTPIRLTTYSHGAGCGCKIAPHVLDTILKTQLPPMQDTQLLVGNHSRDDAAVYDIGHGQCVLSTTDFFMPIVDDPFTFGQVAATNAISDIYAMGGKPIMAIAILGWPVDKLAPEIAQIVVDGGRSICHQAGISLAGGHSIDAPEPIFGLAVTGIVPTERVKKNNQAAEGDAIYLTKPLGIGILTTAQKRQKLKAEHEGLAERWMCTLNTVGAALAAIEGVTAMTDVTGFGLGGHLREICEGSACRAEIKFQHLPLLPDMLDYIAMGCSPGGALRNAESYAHLLSSMTKEQQSIICDPQTSGGLLVTVNKNAQSAVESCLKDYQLFDRPIGSIFAQQDGFPLIQIN